MEVYSTEGLLFGQPVLFKADVDANLRKLKEYDSLHQQLTEREFAILAVSVTELQQNKHDPFEDTFVVQVDSSLQWVTCFWGAFLCKEFLGCNLCCSCSFDQFET